MAIAQRITVGTSTFETLRNNHYVYVDKTKIIYELITTDRIYFLSRPRRFGKSLLISTLKSLFEGKKELFEGLWVTQANYNWKPHPVIHIDFSGLNCTTPELFEQTLCSHLKMIAFDTGFSIENEPSSDAMLKALVIHLSKKCGKSVLLIDEYDSPILHNLTNHSQAERMRIILSNFYATVKALDEYWHFIFVTGVSKFAKTSIFSGFNNLKDISMDPSIAALYGYTEEELTAYFTPSIKEITTQTGQSYEDIRSEMKHWYNGYRFSRSPISVYNPVSIANYMIEQEFNNYWFSTGTPRFLIDLIKKNPVQLEALERIVIPKSLIDWFEFEDLPLITILYQTGYLTIKSCLPNGFYELDYPNEEVRRSLHENILRNVLHVKATDLYDISTALTNTLEHLDISGFCETIQSLIADIPYNLHHESEAYYHTIFHVICNAIGLRYLSEVPTSRGRIDSVLETSDAFFIIEFKLNKTAQIALDQIEARGYAQRFKLKSKKIFEIGINMQFASKLITYAFRERQRSL